MAREPTEGTPCYTSCLGLWRPDRRPGDEGGNSMDLRQTTNPYRDLYGPAPQHARYSLGWGCSGVWAVALALTVHSPLVGGLLHAGFRWSAGDRAGPSTPHMGLG
eukprot:1123002-Prymnesium_polylepis.2